METIKVAIVSNPRIVAWVGTLFGWVTVDLLYASQVVAAIFAAAVSFCALILTAPKAYAEVKRWFKK